MKVHVVYIGKRLRADGKLAQVFLHRNRELSWKGIKYPVIGRLYVSELNKKAHTMSTRPESPGMSNHSEEQRLEWEALEAAAISQVRQDRLDKQFARHRKIAELLEPLRKPLQRMSYSEKKAFMHYVLDRFTITSVPSTKRLRLENVQLKRLSRQLQKQITRQFRKEQKRK